MRARFVVLCPVVVGPGGSAGGQIPLDRVLQRVTWLPLERFKLGLTGDANLHHFVTYVALGYK